MAKDQNLAEEYLRRKIKKEPFNSLTIDFNFAFSANDIEEAFNAGRESVVENIPELKWQKVYEDGPYLSVTVFNWFYRIEFTYNKFNLFCNSQYISCYISLLEAKQVANENYKQRIKQALGL